MVALCSVLLLGISAQASAQCLTIANNGNPGGGNGYVINTPNQSVCVTANNLSQDITINAPGCTVNFNGSSYTGKLTVTANGTSCTINNNTGSTLFGNQDVFAAAVTINNASGASWQVEIYGNPGSRIASGSTINNAGAWSAGGRQFTPLDGLAINNSGTWSATTYAVSGSPTTIVNSGTWASQLGDVNATLNLTNAAGATWTQTLAGGSGSTNVTNNGTWNAGITFPSGSNSFNNNAGSTATFPAVAFSGTTAIRNANNGGTPTMTFSGSISPNSTTSIINLAGTVNTNSGISSAGSIDNRSTWNASSVSNSGTFTNSSLLTLSGDYANTGGSSSNASTGTISLMGANAGYSNSGGTTTNNGLISATNYTTSGGTTTNNTGATIRLTTYNANGGSTINSGTLNPTGDFVVNNGGGSVTNNSTIAPAGAYRNGSTTTNNGTISPGTYYDNQNSGAVTTNNGSIRPGTYYSNKAVTANNGTIILTNAAGYFENLNSGAFTNPGRVQVAGNFTNNGTFNGSSTATSGAVRVAGISTNTFYGFGASGLLDFCDSTPGSGPVADKGFNVQNGSVATSVTTCLPLPVQLTRFAATAAKGRVLLAWATASEKNSRAFIIERSVNGRDFARIAEVAGQGSTSKTTEYQATDEKPLPGQSYYRLQQVDFDGTTAFSPVVSVEASAATAAAFTLTPNPASDQVVVDLSEWQAQTGTAEVLNLSGQVLLSKQLLGGETHSLNVRNLPAGAYLLRFRTAGQQAVRRLMKL